MLSFSPSSRTRPYVGAVEDYEIYDGDEPFILKQILLTYTWSPIIWSRCERKKKNFYKSAYCALDFDTPMKPLAWAIREYCDMWHIIGVTRSHQIEKRNVTCDRYRVLLKWERPIVRLDEYEHNMERIIKDTEADNACKDGAHCFYRCTSIVSTNYDDEAYAMDVVKAPSEDEKKKRMARYESSCRRTAGIGLLPRHSQWFLTNVVPGNTRHNPRYKLACELARAGVSFDDAMQRLLNSPTYKGKVIDSTEMAEFERVMRAGYSAALGPQKR